MRRVSFAGPLLLVLALTPAAEARILPLPLKRARVTLAHFEALDDAHWRELRFKRRNRAQIVFRVREYAASSFGGEYDIDYSVTITRRGDEIEAAGGLAFEPYYEPY